MRLTRVIAVGVIASSLALSLHTSLQAQTLRTAGPPAEFPPTSFKGNQYVDSRGCVYIRAGVDGNVTWVPRVTRSRKVVCGYKPSLPPGTKTTPSAPRTAGVEQITLPPSAQPKPSASAAASTQTAAAAVPVTPKPRRSANPVRPAAPTTVAPAPARPSAPAPAVRAAQTTARPPSPGPEPTVWANAPRETTPARTTAPVPVLLAPGPSAAAPSPGPEPTVWVNAPREPAPKRTSRPTPVAPTQVATTAPAPRSSVRAPSPGPEPTVFGAPASPPKPVTAQTTPSAPPASATGCSNASEFSNQYVNKGGRFAVRCGPQTVPPVTYRPVRNGASLAPAPAPVPTAAPVVVAQPAAQPPVSQDTRVVRRHIYDKRQNTTNVAVADGYMPVDFGDDRLNPHRAERTLAPAQIGSGVTMPEGYRTAWEDDRLNPVRGLGLASGHAQMTQVWTDTVPRKLVSVPTDRRVIRNPTPQTPGLPRSRTAARAPEATAKANQAQSRRQPVTRTQPPAKAKTRAGAQTPRYVRVASFASDAEARQAAQALARKTNLPVRLGTATRAGKSYRVIMAGPFAGDMVARKAVAQVRGAGYASARLLK